MSVDLVARARAAGAGIERPLVQRHREDRVVAAEDRVGAVAVVHVPVDDRDALESERVLGVASGDRDVAEEAEAHRAVGERVVARRPDEREPADRGRLGRAARREQSGLPDVGPAIVSPSSHVGAASPAIVSRYDAVCTRSSCSRVAGRPAPGAAERSRSSASRSSRSGWWYRLVGWRCAEVRVR